MDELIGRLAGDLGVDRAAAEKAIAIIFDFLVKEGPTDKVRPLLAQLPGAEQLMTRAADDDSGGSFGGFGGMMGAGGMGGIMGAGMRMMAAGLSMAQVQGVAREVLAFAREKVGDEAVGEAVGAIPGLSQFV
jgi:hypothetical protein